MLIQPVAVYCYVFIQIQKLELSITIMITITCQQKLSNTGVRYWLHFVFSISIMITIRAYSNHISWLQLRLRVIKIILEILIINNNDIP